MADQFQIVISSSAHMNIKARSKILYTKCNTWVSIWRNMVHTSHLSCGEASSQACTKVPLHSIKFQWHLQTQCMDSMMKYTNLSFSSSCDKASTSSSWLWLDCSTFASGGLPFSCVVVVVLDGWKIVCHYPTLCHRLCPHLWQHANVLHTSGCQLDQFAFGILFSFTSILELVL